MGVPRCPSLQTLIGLHVMQIQTQLAGTDENKVLNPLFEASGLPVLIEALAGIIGRDRMQKSDQQWVLA